MRKFAVLGLMLVSVLAMAEGPSWMTDMEAAIKKAQTENKPILVNFSGSDWCGWCKRLDKEVFREQDFKAFANEELVLVNLDFPRYKQQDADIRRQNQAMMQKYRVQGFPTVLLLDKDEKLLLQTGYRRGGAAPYIDFLKEYISPN